MISGLKDHSIPFKMLRGPAGSGKSSLIQHILRENPTWGVKTSTTGISAINIGGSTIHSLLRVRDVRDLLKSYDQGELNNRLAKIAFTFRNIIIDEVSMLDANFFDILFLAITQHNEASARWPLGLVMTGDFAQLPPVEGSPVFESQFWAEVKHFVLTEVHRQDNPDFIQALNLCRIGKVNEALDFFQDCIGFSKEPDPDWPGPIVYGLNKEVDLYNQVRFNELQATKRVYRPYRSGWQSAEWHKHIPNELFLKVGCPVMLLANKRLEGYMNGDRGTVVDMEHDGIIVKLVRGSEVKVGYAQLDSERGSVSFLPVRLGYAITYHKTQSLTMSHVQCSLNPRFIERVHGGAYVGLSRARTSDGLRIITSSVTQFKKCFYTDPKFLEWV